MAFIDSWNEWLRDYAVDGVPASGANEPSKFEGRGVGAELNSLLANAGFTNVDIYYATKALMSADLAHAANTVALVYADSTPDNNDFYVKIGSSGSGSWAALGLKPANSLLASLSSEITTARDGFSSLNARLLQDELYSTRPTVMSGEIIVDTMNVNGGGAAVYIPRTFWIDAPTIGFAFTADIGLVDSRFSGYIKVPVSATLTTAQTIYLDRTDTGAPYKLRTSTGLGRNIGNYYPIITIWNDSISSKYGWVKAGWQTTRTGICEIAPVWDPVSKILLVPTIRGNYTTGSFWVLQTISPHLYREVSIPDSSTAQVVWVDTQEITLNGTQAPDALRVSAFTNAPAFGGGRNAVPIGVVYINKFVSFVGRPGELVPNEFGAGRASNDLATLAYSHAEPVDLTNSGLTALGFTRGWENSTDGLPFYGGRFEYPIRAGLYFVRCYIEQGVDAAWGTPRVYFKGDSYDGGTQADINSNFTLEKEINSTARMYCGWVQITSGDVGSFIGFWAGSVIVAGSTAKVCGVQFARVTTRGDMCSRLDYPQLMEAASERHRLNQIAVGDLFKPDFRPMFTGGILGVEGRSLTLYPDQLFASATGRYRAIYSSGANADGSHDDWTPQMTQSGGGSIEIDCSRLGAAPRLTIIDKLAKLNLAKRYEFAGIKASSAFVAGKSPRVLTIGDSISDFAGVAVETMTRCEAITGVAPKFIGTLTQTHPDRATTCLGECRQSKEMADYIYDNTDVVSPLAAGDEATYLAMSEGGRRAINPFLKVPDGSDTSLRPGYILNGYIFDMGFYLSRFASSGLSNWGDPDVVVISLGTNDGSQQTVTEAIRQINLGLDIMAHQIRRALPDAAIIFEVQPLGRSTNLTRWEGFQQSWIAAVAEFVRTLADPKVFFIPLYAMVSRDAGYPWTVNSTDDIGLEDITVFDTIHPETDGVSQSADIRAQAILASMTL